MEPRLTARHAARTVPIYLPQPPPELLPPDAHWITDENVASALSLAADAIVLPAGETTKSLATFGHLQQELARRRVTRQDTLVAFGGGVIGDLVGFVAATYMRGIKYVQIPTSLLAMVDSSVGGKVAIDLPEGKNLVGSFYPPVAVGLNPAYLQTLPRRQIVNGMAEVWKMAFIRDADWLPELASLVQTPDWVPDEGTVIRTVRHKIEVVEADEFETNGIRATLNFGHTIGHALEQVLQYETYLHGEAISIGMVAEARLGERLGVTPTGTAQVVANLLTAGGLPTESPYLAQRSESILSAMQSDKKNTRGSLHFSLLTEVGACTLVRDVPVDVVRKSLVA